MVSQEATVIETTKDLLPSIFERLVGKKLMIEIRNSTSELRLSRNTVSIIGSKGLAKKITEKLATRGVLKNHGNTN